MKIISRLQSIITLIMIEVQSFFATTIVAKEEKTENIEYEYVNKIKDVRSNLSRLSSKDTSLDVDGSLNINVRNNVTNKNVTTNILDSNVVSISKNNNSISKTSNNSSARIIKNIFSNKSQKNIVTLVSDKVTLSSNKKLPFRILSNVTTLPIVSFSNYLINSIHPNKIDFINSNKTKLLVDSNQGGLFL